VQQILFMGDVHAHRPSLVSCIPFLLRFLSHTCVIFFPIWQRGTEVSPNRHLNLTVGARTLLEVTKYLLNRSRRVRQHTTTNLKMYLCRTQSHVFPVQRPNIYIGDNIVSQNRTHFRPSKRPRLLMLLWCRLAQNLLLLRSCYRYEGLLDFSGHLCVCIHAYQYLCVWAHIFILRYVLYMCVCVCLLSTYVCVCLSVYLSNLYLCVCVALFCACVCPCVNIHTYRNIQI
jgi:hypothetical protein